MRWRRSLAALSAVLFVGGAAKAGPDRWRRIADPRGAAARTLLEGAVRQRLPGDLMDVPRVDEIFALRAATVLDLASAEAVGTPELWYFYGNSLVAADRGRDDDARRILFRALRADPGSPLAAKAWFDVAIASNRLHDYVEERAAYDEALRLQWDDERRAAIRMNRGESAMSLGLLEEAQADYRFALQSATDSQIHALSAWGLAVALARDDDLPDALAYAWDASQTVFKDNQGNSITALDLPGVFFTPSYEIFYYRALGAMAESEHTTVAAERRLSLETALVLWDDYFDKGEGRGDRWAENARHQRRWCERRLEKVVAAKGPKGGKGVVDKGVRRP